MSTPKVNWYAHESVITTGSNPPHDTPAPVMAVAANPYLAERIAVAVSACYGLDDPAAAIEGARDVLRIIAGCIETGDDVAPYLMDVRSVLASLTPDVA